MRRCPGVRVAVGKAGQRPNTRLLGARVHPRPALRVRARGARLTDGADAACGILTRAAFGTRFKAALEALSAIRNAVGLRLRDTRCGRVGVRVNAPLRTLLARCRASRAVLAHGARIADRRAVAICVGQTSGTRHTRGNAAAVAITHVRFVRRWRPLLSEATRDAGRRRIPVAVARASSTRLAGGYGGICATRSKSTPVVRAHRGCDMDNAAQPFCSKLG